MQYRISDTSVIQITETSGTIQNVSNATVEISNSAEFTDSILLYPLNKMTFKNQMYIRAYDVPERVIAINVVPFFVDGGVTEETGGSDAAVDFSQLNFFGNEEITSDCEFTNATSNINLLGGVGNDTIYNTGDNVTITGGKGSNKIFNSGANNVYIYNSDAPDTICGFTDSDTLIVSGENSAIIPTNTGALVSVDANYVLLRGPRIAGTTGFSVENFSVIPAGTTLNIKNAVTQFHTRGRLVGDSVANNLTNNLDYMYIEALAGNDTITNNGDFVTIDSGIGNDTITNSGNYVVIDGNSNYNRFINSGDYVSIHGGTSDDTITNTGDFVTIEPSSGGRYIFNDGANTNNMYIYNIGDGIATIAGFTKNDTLVIVGADADEVTFDVAAYETIISMHYCYAATVAGQTIRMGGPRIPGRTDYSLNGYYPISALNPVNVSYNYEPAVTKYPINFIQCRAGGDTVNNSTAYVTINGGAGADSITNSGDYVSILSAGGKDTITNSGSYVAISPNSANTSPLVINRGNNATIESDSLRLAQIYNEGSSTTYIVRCDKSVNASQTDHKYIFGFNDADTLVITNQTASFAKNSDGFLYAQIFKNGSSLYTELRIKGERIEGTTGYSADCFEVLPTGSYINIKNNSTTVTRLRVP